MRSILLALALVACGAPDRGPPCAPGTICTVAGTGEQGIGEEGLSAHATDLYLPVDVAHGPDGRLFIVDFNNHRVLAIDEAGAARVVAGTGVLGDGPPGPARESALLQPPPPVAAEREGCAETAARPRTRSSMGRSASTSTTTATSSSPTRTISGYGWWCL